jgi:hydroxypyruvate isomerase
MAMIRQSFTWWSFAGGGTDAQALLSAAKEIGYEGVELIGREHWDRAREIGLRIACHGGHRSLTDGLNKRENHNRIEEEIRASLEMAKEYDIPTLIVFSGNRNGLSDEQGAENTAEGLRRVAPAAESAGINLAIELLNSKVDHKDYQCDHTAWGVRVCEMVGSPRVKLLYDIYHMQIMEGDLIRTIREHHPHFAHYHTAGNPGRRDMDDQQEIWYPAVMRAIVETGYDGFVAHEFRPKGDPIAALRHAWALCNILA